MEISPVFLHLFHNRIEHVLHLPGNFTGPVLEMTLVLDCSVEAKTLQETTSVLLRSLKQQSEVFRNVRFCVVNWETDAEITTQVCPMLMAMSESFYQDHGQKKEQKRIELLYQYLKFYHARSKLVLLLTDGKYVVGDEQAKNTALKPFLGRKLIQIVITEKGMEFA